jgi:hypothetical protein
METLWTMLARSRRIRNKRPEPPPHVVMQCLNTEVNIHEAIEKLRAAGEKANPEGVSVVSNEQIEMICRAIKET